MEEESRFCQYYYKDMESATLADTRLALPLRRCWWNLKRDVWYMSVIGVLGFVSKILPTTKIGKFARRGKRSVRSIGNGKSLDMQPGEWVEVKSLKEIFATLDGQGKLRGLRFNKEMARFCGMRFRVYKRLDKMILESTGQLRKIKTPTVMLEGVFCDGTAHGGCGRSCFCFWRAAWLRKTPSSRSQK